MAFCVVYCSMTNEKRHWTIVTAKGTRWAAQGNSEQEVRDDFFGHSLGIEIAEVQPVRLFTEEEEAEMKRDKDEWRSR